MALADILLFPHFDLHMALEGTPPLRLDVVNRTDQTDPGTQPGRYKLTSVLSQCAFRFFAPHKPVGQRLNGLPSVNTSTGVVKAGEPGVYLFQVAIGDQGSVVGRLQVHRRVNDWWFGNKSITTALDPEIGHAEPTIYALFSDNDGDDTGNDSVGDITGHGYVALGSTLPSKVAVMRPRDRLRGVSETTDPVNINGTFLGKTLPLPVRVVNYAQTRDKLNPVRTQDVANAGQLSNLVFLSEGFRPEDEELFNRIVARTVKDLFEKPRHEPYNLLKERFNVFKSFAASQQRSVTAGYRITDNAAVFGVSGVPIPAVGRYPNANPKNYTLIELVARVGLPKEDEKRSPADLKKLWVDQSLPNIKVEQTLTNLELSQVDDELIEAWKAHQSRGILQTVDTMFGTYLGGRWADGSTVSQSTRPVTPPALDAKSDAQLVPFIDRLYDFYQIKSHAFLTLDPRRHPPELYATQDETNPGNTVISYLAGLRYSEPPDHFPVGQQWIPNDNAATRSRGLVVLITYDSMGSGTSLNKGTMTTSTLSDATSTGFTYLDRVTKPVMTRATPSPPATNNPNGIVKFDQLINKIAHEIGHTFNLGDEYEKFNGDDSGALTTDPDKDLPDDNLTRLAFLRAEPEPSRKLVIDKVKWLTLPRMRLSGRLVAPSAAAAGGVQVTVGPRDIAKWVKAKADNTEISLRNVAADATNKQLPLKMSADQLLEGLHIIGDVDQVRGTFVLGGPAVPPSNVPTFLTGSVVYIPLKDKNGLPVLVTEKKVLDFLRDTANGHNLPLNQDSDLNRNTEADSPVSIPGFKHPCKSSRLVGIFEGGRFFGGSYYRPTGTCKMRGQDDADERGEFCYICKWLIVNLVDPGQHAYLSSKFYPKAKKNG